MTEAASLNPLPISLQQLLQRDDVWQGSAKRYSSIVAAVPTGFAVLDAQLVNGGWPLGSLIEVCHHRMQLEWQLFMAACLMMPGLLVLVNPPAAPFAQAFIQAGLDLERLIIIHPSDNNQFIATFSELARANLGAVMAWQPNQALSYTQMRKCVLAASEGQRGLNVLFRAAKELQQSSPAALRLFARLVQDGIEVSIVKQKGRLQTHQARPIKLPLPEQWQALPAHHQLGQGRFAGKAEQEAAYVQGAKP